MEFLWSLIDSDFESWNTTLKVQEFSQYVPYFINLTTGIQTEIVDRLSNVDLKNLQYLWNIREYRYPDYEWSFEEFIFAFVFDPDATDQEVPDLLPTASEFCRWFNRELTFYQSLYMLIPATVVLLILMFIRPRTNACKGCLWGRPSVAPPINFIDEHGRRWAFCGAFAVMTNYIMDFFDSQYFWNPGYWDDPDWKLRYSWVRPLILLGNTIHLGYLFYPLFACLTLRRYIPANIMGLLLSGIWIYFFVDEINSCPIEPPRDEEQLDTNGVTRIVNYVIIFLGELALVVAFTMDLVLNSYRCYLQQTNREEQYKRKSRWGGKETVPLQYIEHLMTYHKDPPATFKDKIKNMIMYTKVEGFKYPPRVICTMVVAFVLLLSLTINIGTTFNRILVPFEEQTALFSFLGEYLGNVENITDPTIIKVFNQAPRYVSGIRGSVIFANVMASLIHFGSMFHMIRTYRTHVRRQMRGDRTWHHELTSSPASKLVYGMRYSGYQIAYLLWAWFIMFALLAIVTIALTIVLIIPLTFGERPFFFNTILIALSTTVATLIINTVILLVSKFAFLQERGTILALTNRRVYHVMAYFIFFFNVVVGLFSVLRRSLLSLIFGTLLLCRLDKCLLMRGFERFDAGFAAYMGMLEVDAHHNHPVLKGFIYILKTEVEDSKQRRGNQNGMKNGDVEKAVAIPMKGKPGHHIDKRIRNKWWKLITLVNNPTLVIERLQKKIADERKKDHTVRDDVVDMIADTGAVFIGTGLGAVTAAGANLVDDVITTTSL